MHDPEPTVKRRPLVETAGHYRVAAKCQKFPFLKEIAVGEIIVNFQTEAEVRTNLHPRL